MLLLVEGKIEGVSRGLSFKDFRSLSGYSLWSLESLMCLIVVIIISWSIVNTLICLEGLLESKFNSELETNEVAILSI